LKKPLNHYFKTFLVSLPVQQLFIRFSTLVS